VKPPTTPIWPAPWIVSLLVRLAVSYTHLIVPKDAALDAKTLPQVKMPNRDGFVSYWPIPKK